MAKLAKKNCNTNITECSKKNSVPQCIKCSFKGTKLASNPLMTYHFKRKESEMARSCQIILRQCLILVCCQMAVNELLWQKWAADRTSRARSNACNKEDNGRMKAAVRWLHHTRSVGEGSPKGMAYPWIFLTLRSDSVLQSLTELKV